MEEMVQRLSEADRKRLRSFSTGIAIAITILGILVFWTGVNFLRETVFKNYFNPSRHIIVEQDPETMEIYVWKDTLGNVYDSNDPDVKRFPYGVMFLILIVLGLATQSYNLMVEHYAMMLLVKNHLLQAELPPGGFTPQMPLEES